MDEPEAFPVGDPFTGWFPRGPVSGFRWSRPGEYRPNDPQDQGMDWVGPWLIPRAGHASADPSRWFDALGDPQRQARHRHFARLADEREDKRLAKMARFAGIFGCLGGDPASAWSVYVVRCRKGPGPTAVYAEHRAGWDEAVFEVAALVGFWDLIRQEKTTRLLALAERSDFSSPGIAPLRNYSFSWFGGQLVAGAPIEHQDHPTLRHNAGWICPDRPACDEPWPESDPVKPARALLAERIARGLSGAVDLLPDPENRFDFLQQPKTLLAAVYLHFAQEIQGRRRALIECADCGKRFERRGRKDQRYCGQSCRSKAYWDRTDYGQKRRRSTLRQAIEDGEVDGRIDGNR